MTRPEPTARAIVPFSSADTDLAADLVADLAAVGGKAVNLIRTAAVGLPVPPGFVVPTPAYWAHVRRTGLDAVIADQLATVDGQDAGSLDRVSDAIRKAFAPTRPDPALAAELDAAYDALGDGPGPAAVAVRSSATAEDLPDLSFAGQQDTYLSVVGHEQLHEAVIGCWSSLWTARAIGYRFRAGIAQEDVALAVIVQVMVLADVSGVMFTANPLTGVRGETVIDATYGLGEALVSGLVEPDHVEAESRTGRVLRRTTGAKSVLIRSREGGGVERIERAASRPDAGDDSLTGAQVAALVRLGAQVQQQYGAPQDIEWAIVADRPEEPYLLQTRAITSLYPLPAADGEDLPVWLSFGAVQGMLAPMTPIGQDAIRLLMAGGARVVGADVDHRTLPYLVTAGERLWIRIDRVLRTRVGREVAPVFLGQVEPSLKAGVMPLLDDPRFAPRRMKPATRARLLRFVGVVGRRVPATLVRPAAARRRLTTATDDFVEQLRVEAAAVASAPDPLIRLRLRLELFRTAVRQGFPTLVPVFGPMILPGMVLFNALGPIAGLRRLDPLTLEVTRSLPDNPTTEMDLALWDVARRIRADAAARAHVLAAGADQLVQEYVAGALPSVAQDAVTGFLARYGFRGVGEIDLGRARWSDEPHDVLQTLATYVALDDGAAAPDEVFRRGVAAAGQAVETLSERSRHRRGGAVRARAVRLAADRVRILLSGREMPKFTMMRAFGVVRESLVESGADLVTLGVLDAADDVVFLHLDELSALAAGEQRDWRGLVRERRAGYEREMRRHLIPRVMVGDGRTVYEGMAAPTGVDGGRVLVGSPVSPGTAEGVVRVVFDPRATRLEVGEVLVCPGTDPAWTPLFLAASALITEVGGMMTHGSVVAREYGIPAVVGVHEATSRLVTGMRVRIDGSAGTITVLDGSLDGSLDGAPSAAGPPHRAAG